MFDFSNLNIFKYYQVRFSFKPGVGDLFGVKGQTIKINFFTGHNFKYTLYYLNKIL